MDPAIHYATASDGVSIACTMFGSGPPVLILPILPMSHLQLEWEMPGMREFLEAVARKRTVVRFDARGLGLSDHAPVDRSLDAHVLDMEAVVERFQLDRFAIFAASYSGPMGIRYAASHPEKVMRLMLWCTHAFHSDVVAQLPHQLDQQRRAVNDLAGVDRDLFIRTYLHRAIGWQEGELANQFVEVARKTIDPMEFVEALAGHAAFDARADLPGVTVPTLVLHRPAFIGSNVEVARQLVAAMPNARLALLDGESVVPFSGDTRRTLAVIESYLDEDQVPAPPAEPAAGSLRVILFTDIEAHSAMVQLLGDDRARDILRAVEQTTRAILREFGGSETKALGDGFLASFGSAQQALRCAIALQRALESAEPIHGYAPRIRVGLNAGEPITEGEGLFGESADLAARITAAAAGGEVLTAPVVRELVAGKGFRFAERAMCLPGGDLRVWEVRWREPRPIRETETQTV